MAVRLQFIIEPTVNFISYIVGRRLKLRRCPACHGNLLSFCSFCKGKGVLRGKKYYRVLGQLSGAKRAAKSCERKEEKRYQPKLTTSSQNFMKMITDAHPSVMNVKSKRASKSFPK
jgi:hypothetical protein